MSWRAMAWGRGKAPTSSSQLVLSGYCDHADDCGVTRVGQETVAKDCSCGVRTVRRGLRALEAVGVAARVRRHDAHGHRLSDWVVIAPFAADRGPMLDVAVKHPELALELRSLPARDAGRTDSLPANLAGRPTGQIDHPYRPDRPSLPANLAGEQLKEPLKEPPPPAAAPSSSPSSALLPSALVSAAGPDQAQQQQQDDDDGGGGDVLAEGTSTADDDGREPSRDSTSAPPAAAPALSGGRRRSWPHRLDPYKGLPPRPGADE
jgi:hypothetical protein